jgi:hypothetical protein
VSPPKCIEDFYEPIWGRQPKEPAKWYQRFYDYLLVGPARTLLEGYYVSYEKEGSDIIPKSKDGKIPRKYSEIDATWKATSGAWHWGKRAKAWDEHNRLILYRKWKERYETIVEDIWKRRLKYEGLTQKVISKIEEMIAAPLYEKRVIAPDPLTGNMQTVILKPVRFSMGDAGKMIGALAQLTREMNSMERSWFVPQEETFKSLQNLVDSGILPTHVEDRYVQLSEHFMMGMRKAIAPNSSDEPIDIKPEIVANAASQQGND